MQSAEQIAKVMGAKQKLKEHPVHMRVGQVLIQSFVRTSLLLLTLFIGALPSDSDAKGKSMAQYDGAVADLREVGHWCRGARTLTRLGDVSAILPLLEAMNSHAEAEKSCLYKALEALGAERHARTLAKSTDAKERASAVQLMELFSDDEQLLPLEQMARTDPVEELRRAAAHTLSLQKRTEAWEAATVRLLDADDQAVREEAITSLAERDTDGARQALLGRLATEPDAGLREKLRAALQPAHP